MFKSVRIQNFRQFKDLTLDNLAQINLITGANNTGKTSLLEALLLHTSPSDPNMVRILANQREMASMLTEGHGAWGWIFRDGSNAEPIMIESQDSMNNRATLTIMTSQGLQVPQTSFPPSNGGIGTYETVLTTSGRPLHSLLLEFEDSQGHRGSSRIRLDGGAPTIEHHAGEFAFKRWYQATKAEPPAETAQIYSRVVLADREEAVVEALRVVDPRLKRLRVLDTGTGPSIHADFGEGKFLPVNVAGQGFSRFLTLACVILDNAEGLVLVDEIENGLHHSILSDMWRVIVRTAVANSVQIFATTHSYECINAAVKGAAEHEDKLALFRLIRRDDNIRVTRVEHEGIQAAVDFALELR